MNKDDTNKESINSNIVQELNDNTDSENKNNKSIEDKHQILGENKQESKQNSNKIDSTSIASKDSGIEQDILVQDPNLANLDQKIEAILFMAGKSVSISDLQKLTNADLYSIKQSISNLQHWYSSRNSWLEIIKVDKSYLMRLKPEYTELVSPIVQETEISKRALRVLAVVAKNNGILQSKVVKMLGTSVYDAVSELKQKGYITTEVKGHSKVLKLTQKFKTYFGEIPV